MNYITHALITGAIVGGAMLVTLALTHSVIATGCVIGTGLVLGLVDANRRKFFD